MTGGGAQPVGGNAEPRIPPLPKEEWSDGAKEALRAAFGKRGADALLAEGPDAPRMPNVLTTLLRHPTLTGPFLVYNSVLLNQPTVDPRLRELMILRVAWRTRAPYEWVQHVRMARTLEISDAQIAAIEHGAAADGWSPLEAALLTATDEMIDDYRISDATWSRLAEQLDEHQLIEVAFIVGTYTGLAMAFNSFGIELDPELHELGAPPLPD